MRTILALFASLLPIGALAQSNPNLQQHQVVTSTQWNGYFSSKADTNGGTLVGPTITLPTITGGSFGGNFSGALNLTGVGTALAVSNNATVGGTLGVTGLSSFSGTATFGIGSGQVGIGLTVNNGLSATRFSQGSSVTWSGSSAPSASLQPLFSSESVAGFASDNLPISFNWMRVLDSTNGVGAIGYQFWEDAKSGANGHTALLAASGNDAFSSYAIPQWTSGTVYVSGQQIAVGYNVIFATSSGTSGGVTPTCSNSVATCSDGTVSWKWGGVVAHSQSNIGVISKANPTVSWGGVTGAPIGDVFGLNSLGTCQAGVQAGCVGYENDFSIPTGNSADDLIGEQLILQSPSVKPKFDNVGWRVASNGSGAAPLDNLMTWGSATSASIVSTTGYGLQAYASGGSFGTPSFLAGAGAIDMQEWAPAANGPFGGGFILRGPGSSIRGNGDIQSNYALVHKTTTGASLDVPEYKVTAVAVTGGSSGTGWTCTGKWARGSDGSIVQVTSISGGAVTGVSLIMGAFSDTNTSPATFTAEQPKNCGGTSATGSPVAPSTFSVDETWALANSGQPVLTLGGTAAVSFANGVDGALPSGPKAGRVYGPRIASLPVNSAMAAANRLWVAPVYIANNATLKTLSFDIGTGNAAAWNARMCVFADTGLGFPGSDVVDSGTVAIGSGSVTGVQTATLAGGGTILKAGTYWVGIMADSASESVFAFNNAGAYMQAATEIGFSSASSLFTNGVTPGYYMAQTFGACPASFSGTPTDGAGQVIPYIAMGY